MTATLRKGSKGDDVRTLQRVLSNIGYGLVPDGSFGELTEEMVRAFQRDHGLTADGIVGSWTWKALSEEQKQSIKLKKSSRRIDRIIVHCTATKEGVKQTVQQIRDYHVKQCGWSDIAYHYVVYLDGSVHEGRSVNIAGAHTRGYNAHSIGVVYVGGLDKQGKAKDTRTEAQKKSLRELLRELKTLYPKATIHGHREFANKACPCFDAKSEYKDL